MRIDMSDQIKQIQASYQPLEDRILLKLHTSGEQEMQAWITRRYLKLLIPALQGQHPKTGEPMFSQKESELNQMQQQQIQKEGNYDDAYEAPENANSPLGSEPILLAQITFKGLKGDAPQLALEPEKGAGIALSYQSQLMGALMKILNQAVDKADWAIELTPMMDVPENVTIQ